MGVKRIPDGYHTVTPSLIVNGASDVISFAEKVFDAKVATKMVMPDGTIGHAEIKIGDSTVFLASPMNGDSPAPGWLYVYVDDVDSVYRKGIETGAMSIEEPSDKFYGDRTAAFKDVAGNHWGIATHVEDVSPEEMERRIEAYSKQTQES
jgi:PhnB protein